MADDVTVKLNWQSAEDLIELCGLEPGGRVQMVIDKDVIDYSIPYCPFDTGTLARSPYAATVVGSGEVVYPGPYAHYQYIGEVYGPNIPVYEDDSGVPTRFFSPPGQEKHPTGRQMEYATDINPLAGSHWVERMAADRLRDIIQEAQSIAGTGHD